MLTEFFDTLFGMASIIGFTVIIVIFAVFYVLSSVERKLVEIQQINDSRTKQMISIIGALANDVEYLRCQCAESQNKDNQNQSQKYEEKNEEKNAEKNEKKEESIKHFEIKLDGGENNLIVVSDDENDDDDCDVDVDVDVDEFDNLLFNIEDNVDADSNLESCDELDNDYVEHVL